MKLEEINLRDPIRIGYYDPFDSFPTIETEFNSKFPLSNLHWRYDALKPVKSIPLLPVQLEEEFPILHKKKPDDENEFLDNVYARLMFLRVTDLDTYRSQVRPLIIEWLKALVKPKCVLWAIVLVSPEGKKDKKSTIIKTSIYDKLRSDFGPGGKHLLLLNMPNEESELLSEETEHILKINESYPDEITKLETYNVVLMTIKLLVLRTFNQKYVQSSHKVEKLKAETPHDAASRLELFQEQLKLASILNDMRCLDESLRLYEELYMELKKPDFGKTDSLSIRELVSGLEYEAFNPEKISKEQDPYVQFCRAVKNREPINIFAVKFGLFVKISILLQTLANFAPSISISSIFISNLFQKVMSLLNDYSQQFKDGVEIDQWLYAMADFHLKLPLAQKLFELDRSQSDINDGMNSTTGILEYSAELELFKRLILNRLSERKGFELPTECLFLSEISLLKTDVRAKNLENFEITVPELALGLQSQESYEDIFKSMTVTAIQYYASCDRIKTIDILSIDLAILHHKKKEYKDALDILQNSYEYFIENGWNYVGGVLLEIFLDCIENIEPEESEHFLDTTMKLFASLNTDEKPSHGINDYGLVKSKRERLKLFQKLTSLAKDIEDNKEFALYDYFSVEILPFIDVADDGQYFIRAEIRNKFGFQIELEHVDVTLSSCDSGNDSTVTFTNNGITIKESGSTCVKIFTRKFCSEVFQVGKISIYATEKLVFSSNTEDMSKTLADDTVIHYGEVEDSEQIFPSPKSKLNVYMRMFPFPDQFRLELKAPRQINLESSSLECVVHNGPNNIENLLVTIATSTNGLQIFSEPKEFIHDSMNANEQMTVSFESDTEGKIVEIQVKCQYELDGQIFEYCLRDSYDLTLKVSISVQDIFRENSIYSKFQIGCVNSQNPVRISSCKFTCPQHKYSVFSLRTVHRSKDSLVVHADQPAFMFYRLVPTTEEFDASDVLDFAIEFSDLRKEAEQILKLALWHELKKRDATVYLYLLLPVLLRLEFDMCKFSVDNSLIAWNQSECFNLVNDTISKQIPPHMSPKVDGLLELLFDGVSLKMPDTSEPIASTELYIPVSLPFLQMLHRTEFVLEKTSLYVVAQPIQTKVLIHSSTKWRGQSQEQALATSSPDKSTLDDKRTFEVTISTEEDWLITGLKRQNFEVVGGDSTTELKFSLVPLNTGELLLPRVAIRAVNGAHYATDLVQENALETVLVVPELEKVTFAF